MTAGYLFGMFSRTPKYLEQVGLLENYVKDEKVKMNELFVAAKKIIPYIPYALSIEQYFWAMSRGQIAPEQYNSQYWQKIEKATGLVPPVQRSDTDFDLPANYYISAGVNYLQFVLKSI